MNTPSIVPTSEGFKGLASALGANYALHADGVGSASVCFGFGRHVSSPLKRNIHRGL